MVVSADGPVTEMLVEAASIDSALARWADRVAAIHSLPVPASLPPVWCSWYQYFGSVTNDDIRENLASAADLGIAVGVVQVDDGHQAEVGDWLLTSRRFGRPVADVADEVRAAGRRPGIWTAPLLAAQGSELYARHPDWMVGDADPGDNWGQRLHVLDVTHPDAAEWLVMVFRTLSAWGFDYFKLDFLYAGALPGRRRQDASPLDGYRRALHLIRDAVGGRATLLGCGAPILPSLGLLDAMRVGPDIATHLEPAGDGDLSAPSQRGAALAVKARAFQHGRFWANDPDCLIARPEMEAREQWAGIVERHGGLRASGDRLASLDGWGLEVTRRLLAPSTPHPLVD